MSINFEAAIKEAIEVSGSPGAIAEICGLGTYQAVNKWVIAGRMPRTEWTGETNYVEKIFQATGVLIPLPQLTIKNKRIT
jgi:hypothetical protein